MNIRTSITLQNYHINIKNCVVREVRLRDSFASYSVNVLRILFFSIVCSALFARQMMLIRALCVYVNSLLLCAQHSLKIQSSNMQTLNNKYRIVTFDDHYNIHTLFHPFHICCEISAITSHPFHIYRTRHYIKYMVCKRNTV